MTTRRILAVFPGHGNERAGMGERAVAEDARTGQLVDLAGVAAGFNARKILARGGAAFHDTRVVQPLLTAISLGLLEGVLRHGVRFDVCLGQSLGELAAWSCAGGLSSEDAVALAAVRGAILGPLTDSWIAAGGGMILANGDEVNLDQTLARANAVGRAGVAVDHGARRYVLWADSGAMRVLRLATGTAPLAAMGPWHSELMAPVYDQFREEVDRVERRRDLPRSGPDLIVNQDGRLTHPAESVLDAIAGQVVEAVEFGACLTTVKTCAVTDIVFFGPSKTMRRIFELNDVSSRYWSVEDWGDVQSVAHGLLRSQSDPVATGDVSEAPPR